MDNKGILSLETNKNNEPKFINYLGCPFNYGMIPRTLAIDGEPLDVVVLGSAIKQGSVVPVKIIGILKLIDKGIMDNKIIAVADDPIFGKINSINELDYKFEGVTKIITTWFTYYKGKGKTKIINFNEVEEAYKILNLSIIHAYKEFNF